MITVIHFVYLVYNN